MNPYVKQAIDVLTHVAEKLEADAKRVDAMVPKLPDLSGTGSRVQCQH